ncbi:MAG TPA: hypothetical protein VFI84_02760 [Candidatus Saccharimonadales bacterium]|nr:hypothetical protein [Candidatus Saccharimonadales bacterium]
MDENPRQKNEKQDSPILEHKNIITPLNAITSTPNTTAPSESVTLTQQADSPQMEPAAYQSDMPSPDKPKRKLAVSFVLITVVIVVAIILYVGYRLYRSGQVHSTNQQISTPVSSASNNDYQDYYLDEINQSRFKVKDVAVIDLSTHSGYGNDAPRFTSISIIDNVTDSSAKIGVGLWETKEIPDAFNPPSHCGDPDPSNNYHYYHDNLKVYFGDCHMLSDVKGIGTLYARDQFEASAGQTGDEIGQAQRAAGYYDYYYIVDNNTLITIFDIQRKLGIEGITQLITNLTKVSHSDMLNKASQLQANQNTSQ